MTNERNQTLRRQIIALLEEGPMTVRDLSRAVGIMEKDVFFHLESVEKTVRQQGKRIQEEPYTCLGCGFVFKERKTFKKPGRCPMCRKGQISPAVYSIP